MPSRVAAFPTPPRPERRLSAWLSLGAPLARLSAGFRALSGSLRERRYLDEMDDRTLRDIGATRADIEAELRRSIDWMAHFRK